MVPLAVGDEDEGSEVAVEVADGTDFVEAEGVGDLDKVLHQLTDDV